MRPSFGAAAVLCALIGVASIAVTSMTVDDAAKAAASQSTEGRGQSESAARPLHRHPSLFGMLVRNNNLLRRRAGLWPHRMSPPLDAAAQDHANYMARTGQFSHYANWRPQGAGQQVRTCRRRRPGEHRHGRRHLTTPLSCGKPAERTTLISIVSGTTDAGFGYAVGPTERRTSSGSYGNELDRAPAKPRSRSPSFWRKRRKPPDWK